MPRRTRHLAPVGALLVALTILVCPSAALAAISPTEDPQAIAGAIMATPAQLTGATWQQRPLNIDPSAIATSFGTQPAGSAFPTHGDSFAILSSGNAHVADDPDVSPEVSASGWGADRGDSHDVSALRLDVNVPAKANCLSLDFAFLSEEYPDYVGEYNDAFIAELDMSDWSASGVDVSAPHNFAFDDDGDVASINAGGVAAVSLDAGDGTTYNAATARISASTPITPGPHRIYLSISDNGDWALDSAAFVDNLQIGNVANPSVNCRAGARPAPPRFTQSGPRSATGREGSLLTTSGSFSDAGATPLMLSISPNPGSFVADADGSWTWSLLATDDLQLGGITVSATSGFGFADSETFDAIATNVAPTVTLDAANDSDVAEGPGEHVVRYAISDPGADTIGTVVTSCGPGTKVPGSDRHSSTEGSFACVFGDGPASALVTAQATDDDGGESALASQLVTVHNVAPAVTLAGDQRAFDEGAAQRTFAYAISDPGRDTIASVTADCGDGGRKVAGSSQHSGAGGSFACVFADGPAAPTVTVAAQDSDGALGATDSRAVVIADVAPKLVLDGSNPSSVDEGSGEVVMRYWTEDPGDDVVTVTSSCGEQGEKVAGSDAAGRFACAFADGDAVSTIAATPVDSDGLAGAAGTRQIRIDNVAPRVTLRGGDAASVDEGPAERTFEYAISDPGRDSATAMTACGDGGTKVALSDRLEGAGGSFRCVFADGPATSRVTVVATDSDGAAGPAGWRNVSVDDVAPTATLDADNPLSVQESRGGHLYRYAISDPGVDTIEAVQTSCGTAGAKVADSDRFTQGSGRLRCVFATGPARSEVSVRATDSDGRSGVADTQIVTIGDPLIAASAVTIEGVESAPVSAAVARFTDPTPYADAGEYAATIDWGDGSTVAAGTIRKLDAGTFAVEGTHAYRRFGTYDVAVRIADADNADNGDRVRSTATIADAPIRAAAAAITTPLSFSGGVATFADEAEPDGAAGDFAATIDWGDASARSTGTIAGPRADGRFAVSGAHVFRATGRYTVTVAVRSTGGSTDTTTSTALVYAFASSTGASFTISDRQAQLGTAVTFWSAQWHTANPFLSNVSFTGAFKGFVDPPASMTPPQCGDTWSGRTGGSSAPPSTVPAYMALVVASAMEKTGSTVSGDVERVVVVKTDAGYASDLAHNGTGTVVAPICG
jgi:hypothetical protein